MIRWITPSLATGPFDASPSAEGQPVVLDVRELVDKAGNLDGPVSAFIERAATLLGAGERVLVCCDYGMSRSNAIAAGALSKQLAIPLDEALERVSSATGERAIKLEVIAAVRRALGETPTPRGDGRRVLMTGGHGFIGSHLAPRLRALGFDVATPTRAEVDLVQGPTQLELAARRHAADLVVHLASPRVYTNNAAMGESLAMLRNVIDVCGSNRIPLVFLSSWEVYSGYRTAHVLAHERLPALPRGPYGETKLLCERLLSHHCDHHGLSLLVIRLSPVYGLGSDRPRFIHTFLAKARRGEPITTHVYDNGPPRLDLLYLDDAVEGLARAIAKGLRGELNLGGGGGGATTREVAELLIDLTGSSSELRTLPVSGHMACIEMDIQRARELLDWKPNTDLRAGLARLVQTRLG